MTGPTSHRNHNRETTTQTVRAHTPSVVSAANFLGFKEQRDVSPNVGMLAPETSQSQPAATPGPDRNSATPPPPSIATITTNSAAMLQQLNDHRNVTPPTPSKLSAAAAAARRTRRTGKRMAMPTVPVNRAFAGDDRPQPTTPGSTYDSSLGGSTAPCRSVVANADPRYRRNLRLGSTSFEADAAFSSPTESAGSGGEAGTTTNADIVDPYTAYTSTSTEDERDSSCSPSSSLPPSPCANGEAPKIRRKRRRDPTDVPIVELGEQQPVKCGLCSKRYQQHNSFYKHMYEHHPFWGTVSHDLGLSKHAQVMMMQSAEVLLSFKKPKVYGDLHHVERIKVNRP